MIRNECCGREQSKGHYESCHHWPSAEPWAADRPAEPTPPTNDVLTDVKVVAGEPTPTGADRPTTDWKGLALDLRGAVSNLPEAYGGFGLVRRTEVDDALVATLRKWAEARQQPQPLDVDVRLRAARFVAEHWRDEAMRDPQAPIMWGAVAHACAMVLAALDGETEPTQLGISESKHGEFRARLSSDPARPSPTEEPR